MPRTDCCVGGRGERCPIPPRSSSPQLRFRPRDSGEMLSGSLAGTAVGRTSSLGLSGLVSVRVRRAATISGWTHRVWVPPRVARGTERRLTKASQIVAGIDVGKSAIDAPMLDSRFDCRIDSAKLGWPTVPIQPSTPFATRSPTATAAHQPRCTL